MLHCHPLPSKRSGGMFPGLSSYFTDRSSFGGLREMNVLHLAEDDRALVVDFDPLVGMEKAGILLALTLTRGLVCLGCRSWKRCTTWTGSLGSSSIRFSFGGSNTHTWNFKILLASVVQMFNVQNVQCQHYDARPPCVNVVGNRAWFRSCSSSDIRTSASKSGESRWC